tara:strand:+ start:748 stop:1308 length:561 start_codon:yes stop_codon:yes gene_type:complete
MSEFVYLMRNGDLYKIGCTSNLESEANRMKPGKIISSFKTKESKSLEVRLMRLFKKRRIPETNYFRLSEPEVNYCMKHLEGKSNLSKGLGDELRIGLNGSLLFGSLTFMISYLINKMLILSFFFSIAFASLPMWSLAILGNFGGFDVEDLSLFSTVSIRLKGFMIAISMVSVAYVVYTFSSLSMFF